MSESDANATVKDVAEAAGVSTATVSRVLNGDAKVRPETAARVMEQVEKLGYRMNRIARSLKTNRTHTIGIVAPEFKNEFFMSIVTGIEESLKQENYSVILCSSRESREEEEERLRLLKEKSVDGVIIIPGCGRGEHFHVMDPTPMVLVDRLAEGYEGDAVLSDNLQGSFEAVSLSLAKGAKRIGFLGGDMQLSSARERYEGYLKALKGYGKSRNPELELFGNYHEESGYELMKSLMERDDPPDHVFISNYFMHIGAARFLLEQKEKHEGLHILSFDDMPLAAFFPYSGIIVAQPMEEIGREASRLLLSRIRGEQRERTVLRLPTTLRIIKSLY